MDAHRLGARGPEVTPIGFGAFKIGRNVGVKYPLAYELPSEEDASRVLNGVLDLGINLIDTAPAYGESEERIGRSIAHRRAEFVLSTKVGETFEDGISHYDFSRSAIESSLSRSLDRLRCGHLDIVLIHSDGDDEPIMRDTPVIEVLEQWKARGDVGAIGLSGKTVAGARAALSWADVIMVEYHMHDASHAAVMEQAAAAGVGVLVKKGLGSGRLPAAEAVRFVLQNDSVASLVVGTLNLDHLSANLEAAAHARE